MKPTKFPLLFTGVALIGSLPYLFFWLRHKLVFGLNPMVSWVFFFLILFFLFPVAIKLFKRLRMNQAEEKNTEVFVLFIIGAIFLIIQWLLSENNSTIDLHIRDTFYIISSPLIILIIALLFALFGLVYFIFSKFIRRPLSIVPGRLHFWVTFIVIEFFISANDTEFSSYGGLAGFPRRYVEYAGWPSFAGFQFVNYFARCMVVILLLAQVIFLLNILYSTLRRRKF